MKELLALASEYRMVVVSGCQRSGTHIMAKILAHELGWQYITDEDYDVSDFNGWANLILTGVHMAAQCPHMTHLLHETPDDVLVVWMHRPIEELIVSFARVNPGHISASQPYQMLFYSQLPEVGTGRQIGAGWIKVREQYWNMVQRPMLGRRGVTFNYHDLEEHRLFVHNRTGWTMNQTEGEK